MSYKFTQEDDDFLRENYLQLPVKTMAKILGRSGFGTLNRLKILNLEITEEAKERNKQSSYFKKGHKPMNKGLKMEQYMSAESIKKVQKTQFKKGSIPPNSLKDLEEVKRKDKTGIIYTLIKPPGERKLKSKQVYIWETHYKTKVEKGFNVIFKDYNTENFDIDNLECISNKELLKRNQESNSMLPEDLREIIKLKNKIKKTIKNETRNNRKN